MIYVGDCREVLRTLPDCSASCCVTSPPYFGLRDYGHADQIGLESDPVAFVSNLVGVFREVRRVLRDDGTLWLNIGDTYATQGGAHGGRDDNQRGVGGRRVHAAGAGDPVARRPPESMRAKNLIGIPWRLAFALQADGWNLRQDIIWHKPNPMPESVRDRCTRAHEYVFLLSKSDRYFFDAKAIAEPASRSGAAVPYWSRKKAARNVGRDPSGNESPGSAAPVVGDVRNARDVWTIGSEPFRGAHFATMPLSLAQRCVAAGCARGGVVLDPFCGAGTTGVAAARAGHAFVGIELNPDFAKLAADRIRGDAPLLNGAL